MPPKLSVQAATHCPTSLTGAPSFPCRDALREKSPHVLTRILLQMARLRDQILMTSQLRMLQKLHTLQQILSLQPSHDAARHAGFDQVLQFSVQPHTPLSKPTEEPRMLENFGLTSPSELVTLNRLLVLLQEHWKRKSPPCRNGRAPHSSPSATRAPPGKLHIHEEIPCKDRCHACYYSPPFASSIT